MGRGGGGGGVRKCLENLKMIFNDGEIAIYIRFIIKAPLIIFSIHKQ